MGQELHSCVIAILADKVQWDQSKQAVTAMEKKHAFGRLRITNETALSDFSDPAYYQPFLPAHEDTLKSLDPDGEILETSFSPRAIVLICTKIVKKVLAVAVLERTECFLSSTTTFESLTKWADAIQNHLMNEAGSSSGQTSVSNRGTEHGRRGSGT